MGCNEVGTEHLLLGVIQEPEGARNALTGAKIELESTRSAVSDLVGAAPAGDGAKKKGNGGIFDMLSREEEPLPFTGAAKRTFRGALEEAQRLNQDEVRSEHLLLAMLGDEARRPTRPTPSPLPLVLAVITQESASSPTLLYFAKDFAS